MKVSVAVCTYNGEAFLAEQLRTFLTQSRLPDEVVIGDDASTDGTWAIVEAFVPQARARGVDVVADRHGERVGYVANFSRTLEKVTGDVVFLCDQDDAWHPDKVSTMLAQFVDEPDLTFLHSDARLVDSSGKDMGHGLFDALELTEHERQAVRAGDAFIVYLRRNLATGAASAFRRSLLDIALPLPVDWVHDAWLATLAAALGQIDIVDDALVDYRQHGNNQIGISRRTMTTRVADLFRPRNHVIRADAERLGALVQRLESRCADYTCLEVTREMHAHLLARLKISAQPIWKRVGGVANEWMSGRYGRFGTGYRSALRDMLRIG